MEETHITHKQLIIFALLMSFVVAVVGTVIGLMFIGPRFGFGAGNQAPLFFPRPNILGQSTPAPAAQNLARQEDEIVSVVGQASPAVVSVVASKDVPVIERSYIDPFEDDPFFRQFFGDQFQVPQYQQRGTQRRDISSGSGFIVAADGWIVTNRHVVSDTTADYTVFLNDGSKKSARVHARDPINDIAVLKIDANNLPTVKLGDSSSVKIGQTAIAIGNPLEFRNTVSVGVISGLHRSIMASDASADVGSLQELIQTDAAINPGNSGGPLLNLRGEVVAMNTAMAQGAENIGFAIPVNNIKRAVDSARTRGKIIYPFLGVNYQIVTKDMAETRKLGRDYGALILKGNGGSAVAPGSPAASAGLRENDIILTLNGEKITPESPLITLIQKYDIGTEVTLRIFRDGKEADIKVKLGERK